MVTFSDKRQLHEHQHMPDTRRSQGLRYVEEKHKTERERTREGERTQKGQTGIGHREITDMTAE